jgi:hypothetical protein
MTRPMSLEHLMRAWRTRAEELRPYTAPTAAAFERAAAELEETLTSYLMEPLTLAQAEAESGYSRDHLARKVRNGALSNAGRRRAPRILRRDLPRKATSLRLLALPAHGTLRGLHRARRENGPPRSEVLVYRGGNHLPPPGPAPTRGTCPSAGPPPSSFASTPRSSRP